MAVYYLFVSRVIFYLRIILFCNFVVRKCFFLSFVYGRFDEVFRVLFNVILVVFFWLISSEFNVILNKVIIVF